MDEINNYKWPNELTTLLERSNTGYVNNDEMMRDQAGLEDEPGTNSHWLLSGEAGEAAAAVEAGDASLGYSSEIWVAG